MQDQPKGSLFGLAVNIAWLAAAIIGFVQGGWLGALTGVVAGLALYIMGGAALSRKGGASRNALAFGFGIGLVLIVLGLAIGGWRWGWAGAIAGLVLGTTLSKLFVSIAESRRATRDGL